MEDLQEIKRERNRSRNKIKQQMKLKADKTKKKDPGFTKEFTTRVKKGMSPKERKDAEKRDAYEIGLRNKKKGGIRGAATQIIDNAVGVGRGTASERKQLKKGYKDMKKAQKAKKLKAGGKVKSYRHGGKCKIDGIAIRGKTKAKQRRS